MAQQFGNHLVSYALTLGPTGRIAEKIERVGYRQTRYAYEYDPKGRLVQVCRDGRHVEKYGYDAAGRRSWDWSPARGKRRLEYDRADRLRRAGELEFYYRPDNTLGSRHQGKKQALHLDYGGNLGLRSLANRHGRAVDFRSNQAGQPLAKYVDGELVEAFRWLDLVRLAEYQCLDRGYRLAFHYRDGSRVPYAATFTDGEGSRPLVFGCDQVGSLKAVADAHGQLIKIIDYDSFGNVRSEDWPWLFIPIGFAGGLRDRDTGFVRFGHRDYDPAVGRFNAQDPLGDTGGDHDLYEYCVDDPVNAVDPEGLMGRKPDALPQEGNIQNGGGSPESNSTKEEGGFFEWLKEQVPFLDTDEQVNKQSDVLRKTVRSRDKVVENLRDFGLNNNATADEVLNSIDEYLDAFEENRKQAPKTGGKLFRDIDSIRP